MPHHSSITFSADSVVGIKTGCTRFVKVPKSNYGSNPWKEKNQVVTSLSWVSRIEDAKDSLLRSNWDLIIVDEAHKMSANSSDDKTLAYKLGTDQRFWRLAQALSALYPNGTDEKRWIDGVSSMRGLIDKRRFLLTSHR